MDPQLLIVLLAFIAPVSAIVAGLGGVIIGQRMARNTAAQQIDAQDRRDKLARDREDRFRHVDPKRELYANLVSVTIRYLASLQSMKEVASRFEPQRSYLQVKEALVEAGAELPETVARDWPLAYANASLVAPDVIKLIGQSVGLTMQIDSLLIDLDDGGVTQETIEQWEARLANMTEKMGIDLGADPGPAEIEPT